MCKIVSYHGSHFEDAVWIDISSLLKFEHQYSSPYYPQGNGQVEAVNKILKTILQQMVDKHKSNWHHLLFFALWAYRTSTKTATGFTPFQLVHGVESVLPIECHIPSLCLSIELLPDTSPLEQFLLMLEQTSEEHHACLQMIKVAKTRLKSHYESHVHPCTFSEGDLVLI